MDPIQILFLVILLIVAFMYSSIGHGGASGYLALMAIFGIETTLMKGSALILNLFVAGIAFYQYQKNGHFKWKLFWPFALASIPFAFLGGTISLDPNLYKKILGIFLIFAVLRIIGVFGKESEESKELKLWVALLIGSFLGFFSGLIGIGGGIILSPLILLLHWANMKQTAAVSALFILVNSISGLIGLTFSGFEYYDKIYIWIAVAFSGGILGAYLGAKIFNNKILKYVLAIVLGTASIKLIVFP